MSRNGVNVVKAVRKKTAALQCEVGDINLDTDWSWALAACDTVVHLAARAHILNDHDSDPLVAFREVNVQGTLNLVKSAADSGVKRFIYLSSIGVHGPESFSQPFSETSALRPQSPYAISKMEAEEGVRQICRQTAMEFVIIRPPLVYSAHAPGNFGRLLKLAYANVPLPFAAVNNKRSLVSLENLVDFIYVCMGHPGAANNEFVVADGQDISTASLILQLRRGMGKQESLFPVPLPLLVFFSSLVGQRSAFQQLCGSLQVDISKARELLNWLPALTTDEGLRKAAAEYAHEKTV
jgi:nucleoside-diphosphate-sugar epimerase